MPKLGTESLQNLEHVRSDMVRVVNRAILVFDFKVDCGHRDEAAQHEAKTSGHSTKDWPDSRHNYSLKADGTKDFTMSDAVDLLPYPVQWPDIRTQTTAEYCKRMGAFYQLAGVMLASAQAEGVIIRWGGNWKTLVDMPHFEVVLL